MMRERKTRDTGKQIKLAIIYPLNTRLMRYNTGKKGET